MLRWGVVGIGIAGRARARAVLDSEHDELVHVWRGRHAAELGVPQVESFDQALQGVDAIAIASPSEHHGAQVRAALEAGLHVLVEFPLARSHAEAQALFALAAEQGKVLHVEHIELLEAAGRTLCGQVPREALRSVTVRFERRGPSEAGAPHLAWGNVARLHRLVALAGPVEEVVSVRHAPGVLQADLRTASGVVARLEVEQAPYLQRTTQLTVEATSGRWEQRNGELTHDGRAVSLLGTRSLFASDQRVASARIREGHAPYVDDATVLQVLAVAERLAKGEVGPLVR
jgi:biliverdin reductase